MQATFVSLAAAGSVGVSSPVGLALVVGVPSLGIFLVSCLPCLLLAAASASARLCGRTTLGACPGLLWSSAVLR